MEYMDRETIEFEYEEEEQELTPLEQQQIDKRRARRVRKMKRRKRMGLYIFLLIILVIGLFFFARSAFFTIQEVTVTANEFYTDEQIIEMCNAKTGVNLFSVKTGKMERALEKDTYIESAKIRRKLPSTLDIEVKERKELAGIKTDNRYYIIDPSGMVLNVVKEKPSVTRVLGYTVISGEKAKSIEIKEKSSFTKTINMLTCASKSTITFKKVKEKDNIVKAYVYSNLYVRGTAKDIENCIKSGSLEAVLYDLTEKKIRNGMIRVGDEDYCVFSPEN